ncbi:SPFH domain-containing protein [Agrococcus sp. SL85]|uniref:flotillin family protein n=1 Tax=Agrococcus sp. SL85 TaxID=2995141 RepID=UPI00226D1161|nr:flotillin family protein [Agrococcus sp. SL85]WAC66828.1 SPFH domain-containing protein [Agrococcus sp. SL85]
MDPFALLPTVGLIAAGALVVIVLVSIVIRRYRIAEPDEAIIVTGRRGRYIKDAAGQDIADLSGQKVVTGGGVFVLPFVQKAFVMELRSRRLLFNTTAQTKNGITIHAQAVAVIKVGGSEEMIRNAAQRFLSQQEEIESSTQEVLSGSLRGIIGQLTVLDIIHDRKALADAVLQAAEDALTKQGLVVDTLQIQEINDNQNYIANLGVPESAAVQRAAAIANTEAQKASEQASIEAKKQILEANRVLKLQEAAVQAETDKALAQASAAKPLEDAVQRQAIVQQEEITAQRETELKEQRLNAEVRKVADAESYRIQVTAEANAKARATEANADRTAREARAEASKAEGAAEASVTEARGNAQRTARIAAAEAAKAEGEAEAVATEARGRAEAASIGARGIAEGDAIAARAKALDENGQVVLAQELMKVLPQVAEAFAKAYASSSITVVSTDGTNRLTSDMVGNMASMTQMMKDATGIDLQQVINANAQGSAAGAAVARASDGRGGPPVPGPRSRPSRRCRRRPRADGPEAEARPRRAAGLRSAVMDPGSGSASRANGTPRHWATHPGAQSESLSTLMLVDRRVP